MTFTDDLKQFTPMTPHVMDTDAKARMKWEFMKTLLAHMIISAPDRGIRVTHGVGTPNASDDTTWLKQTSQLSADDVLKLSLLNGNEDVTTDIISVDLNGLAGDLAESFYCALSHLTEVHRMEIMARMGIVHSMGKHTGNDPKVIAKLLCAKAGGTATDQHDAVIFYAAAELIDNITITHAIPHNSTTK